MSKQQTITGFFVSNAANSSRTGNISGSAAGKPAIANVNNNVHGNADNGKSNDIEFETTEDRPIPDDVSNIIVDNNNNDESMSNVEQGPKHAKRFKSDKKLPGTVTKRNIRGNWFSKYKWLRHDKEKKLFFCGWCLNGGKYNVFTTGKPADIPKADDFRKHADSKDHRFMVEAQAAQERGDMPKAKGKIYTHIKDAIQATMKNIYFLVKQDIAKEKMKDFQEHVMLQVNNINY